MTTTGTTTPRPRRPWKTVALFSLVVIVLVVALWVTFRMVMPRRVEAAEQAAYAAAVEDVKQGVEEGDLSVLNLSVEEAAAFCQVMAAARTRGFSEDFCKDFLWENAVTGADEAAQEPPPAEDEDDSGK